jgi:hypothetical protein
MSFDPWTLAFQLLNFAVLLWVLSRLLFRPIRGIMERRAAQVQAALDAAEQARAEAGQLKAERAGERERVEAQRAEMLRRLEAEIEEHRQRRLAARQRNGGAGRARALRRQPAAAGCADARRTAAEFSDMLTDRRRSTRCCAVSEALAGARASWGQAEAGRRGHGRRDVALTRTAGLRRGRKVSSHPA